MTAEQKLTQRLSQIETTQLEEIITKLFENNNNNADIPLDYALTELETRMTEEAFIKFCDGL